MTAAVLSLITAFLGWAGGRGDDFWKAHPKWPRWILQNYMRDWVMPVVFVAAAWILGVKSWWILAVIPMMAGALSTYLDELFGYDNFFAHGFLIGLSAFPIALLTGTWGLFCWRCIILAIWMGAWSGIFKNDHIEDLGRYAIIGATIPMIT